MTEKGTGCLMEKTWCLRAERADPGTMKKGDLRKIESQDYQEFAKL